ncbi:MAG: GGDEF domain-containing protein [Hyphomonadaceae bacterium]
MNDTDSTIVGPLGHAVAHETLDLMALYGVPATSSNYEVWITYRLGRHQALKQAVDEQIARGEPFTPAVNNELYERFFTGLRVSAQMVMAGEKIARDLANVMSVLESAGARSDDYGRTLENAAGDLSRSRDEEGLRQIVASLSAATLDMANHNRVLTDQLQKSSREIDSLRASLESVRVESLTDGLTGLANRRMFDETLRMRLGEARACGSDLCLVMVDIDHFKRFNDTWGHHTGDQVIRFVASALQSLALPDHLVTRYGGEEFAVIMPRASLDQAQRIAESLRATIQAKRLRRRSTNEDLGQVTVSAGIARLQPGDTPQGLMERADACLYASKRDGRNKVTTENVPVLYVA